MNRKDPARFGFFRGPRAPLDGACVLITGASAGIGAEFARQLGARAKTLILVARREKRLLELQSELRRAHPSLGVHVIACDVSRTEALDHLIAKIKKDVGDVDILVNNAGLGDFAQLEDADWTKIEQMIRVNVLGLTHLTRALVPQMIERGRGGILMVGSSSGFQTLPGVAAYSATKYYVRGLSDALRAELRPHGIAVTQLCPGPVATEFADVALGNASFRLPGFIEITPTRCVGAALSGFARGKAVVIPGVLINSVMGIQTIAPRFVLRWFLNAAALFARPHLNRLALEKRAAPSRAELTATQH